jgi:hypothetical protein
MIRTIERLRHLVLMQSMAPAVLIIINLPPRTDPIAKRPTGYAGILPVPAVSPTSPFSASHLDPLLAGKRDTRSDRGRVLYAAGHAPRDTAATLARATQRHHPCPEQRVGDSSPRSLAPNT